MQLLKAAPLLGLACALFIACGPGEAPFDNEEIKGKAELGPGITCPADTFSVAGECLVPENYVSLKAIAATFNQKNVCDPEHVTVWDGTHTFWTTSDPDSWVNVLVDGEYVGYADKDDDLTPIYDKLLEPMLLSQLLYADIELKFTEFDDFQEERMGICWGVFTLQELALGTKITFECDNDCDSEKQNILEFRLGVTGVDPPQETSLFEEPSA